MVQTRVAPQSALRASCGEGSSTVIREAAPASYRFYVCRLPLTGDAAGPLTGLCGALSPGVGQQTLGRVCPLFQKGGSVSPLPLMRYLDSALLNYAETEA
jgi:hypothetical protein